jgi:RNA polymerase I-specific transcription initiation factor RRN7
LLPGEGYRIYQSSDVLGDLPEPFEVLLRRAAGWAGIEMEDMGAVVERYERRLVRWWEDTKRKKDESASRERSRSAGAAGGSKREEEPASAGG